MNKSGKLLFTLAASCMILSGCGNNDNGGGKTSVELPEFNRPTAQKFTGSLNLVGDEDAYVASLGAMERWAVEHYLTGLTLYDNTSYVMYHPSVEKGSQTYIPSYGFGIQREGNLTADLEGESNAAYKRYYHSVLSADPNTLKYMDSKEETVGTLAGNIAATLWTVGLNATKDDYEWSPELAKDAAPVPCDSTWAPLAEGATKSTKYRVEVKVGDEWKYNTNSSKSAVAAYNGRGLALEDYITPYKIYYTKGFGLQRSAENLEGSGSFKGTKAYYEASGDGFNETAWADVGIKSEEKDGHSYLLFEFNKETTISDARNYLSSSMMNPVPMEFVKDTLGGGNLANGVKLWGNYSTNFTDFTPLDTVLSTGPYTVEKWDKDQLIVFKRNPNFPSKVTVIDSEGNSSERDIYRIQGLHYNILPAITQDSTAAFKEFLANKTHSCSIPADYLTQYQSDPRTTVVEGTTTYRLNLNTCTQEFWNYNFGEDGVAYQNAQSDYWICEPIMSNNWFDRGLSYALDRVTLAGYAGCSPFVSFLSNAYSLGEGGEIWNKTEGHTAAIESLLTGTDGFGYNLEYAKECFKRASEELIADGTYTKGDTIELDCKWYSSSQFEKEGVPFKQMIEAAFNNCGGGLKLNITNTADDSDPYAVFDYLEQGRFDIAIGGISGMEYWPLEFMETLKSDNSSGYTLGFGCDTNECDGTIILPLSEDPVSGEWFYDPEEGTDYSLSFDALFFANTQGTLVVEGKNVAAPLEIAGQDYSVLTTDDSGNLTSIETTFYLHEDKDSEYTCEIDAVVFYYYDYSGAYHEALATTTSQIVTEGGVEFIAITAKVTDPEVLANVAPYWTVSGAETYTGFDVYVSWFTEGSTEPILEGYFLGTAANVLPAE